MYPFTRLWLVGLVIFSLTVNCAAQDAEAGDLSQDDLISKNIPMPAIPRPAEEFWINSSGGILDSLKGKVVLVDFWEYTCVNCLRTLPYVREWNRRYAGKGLLILGVHAPEFEFGKQRANVERAVRNFSISYPVVMDNDYGIWTIFGNRYWPAKYLFDRNGILRYTHFGEGNYGETEAFIQKLLKEINPGVDLPPVMEPVRPEDKPGAVCYRQSPETYLGYERGMIGNAEGFKQDQSAEYTAPTEPREDRFYLSGRWKSLPESVRLDSKPGEVGSIIYSYSALDANLVIHPEGKLGFDVVVEQDGKPVPADHRGEDLIVDGDGRTVLHVDVGRMYRVIHNPKFEHHLLKLTSASDSFGAYAFTFTTACEEPGK